MAKALTKSQVVAAIAEKNSLSKKQADEIMTSIADLAYKEIRQEHLHALSQVWASWFWSTARRAWAAILPPVKPSRSKPNVW